MNYIKTNLTALLIGILTGLIISMTYNLIDDVIVKIALIHLKN